MIIDEYGLSSMQQGMLFQHLAAEHSGVDVEQLVIGYKEAPDVAMLERAWQAVVEKHPVMRTSFRWERLLEPTQQVHDQLFIRIEQHQACDEATFSAFLSADRRRSFDLNQPPLMRLTLFASVEGPTRLVWTVHHILMDGRACVIVLNEVEQFYDDLLSGFSLKNTPGLPYKPYTEWVEHLDLSGANDFWRQKLQGLTRPTPLPGEPDSSPKDSSVHNEIEIRLSENVTSRLRDVVRKYNVTLNTIVMGSWAILLGRFSGESEVVFGAVKTARRNTVPDADSIVGLFLNTIPVRVAVNPTTQVGEMLKQLYAEWIWVGLRRYDFTPLVQVKRVSDLPKSEPIFNSLVVFENQGFDTALAIPQPRWRERDFTMYEQIGLPLALSAFGDGAMALRLEYDVHRFSRETAVRILAHLVQIFASVADNPDEAIGNLRIIPDAERHQMLVEWNATERAYPRETSLAALVEAQVERTPDAVAVACGEQKLTYRELNERANQLAEELRKFGAGPDQLVGLFVDRSIGMVMALLAIVKAGAAYLPLDPLYPPERLRYMLEDSRVPVIVTEQSMREKLPSFVGETILLEDTRWQGNHKVNLDAAVGPGHLAYVIYTSGSTGKPKGVQVPRGALTNFLWSMREWLQLSERDRLLAVTTISFDIAGLEVWLPLLVGAQTVVASREQAPDGIALRGLLEQYGITFLQGTPVTWRLLFDAGWPGKPDLQAVCGGEAMPPEVAAPLTPVVKKLWNLYGPTETTIWSTGYLVEDGHAPILIGRPLANTRCYILDGQGQLVPVGATGELHISGDGLARGYLNRPELTAEKFVPDPFREDGTRMYRTGDLARYRADGKIECLGRIDHQVKLRGYRIELGEIESLLKEQPEIREALVIAREDKHGDKRLVAYLVATNSSIPPMSELRIRLRRQLPDYMVPTACMFLDQLPISPAGKVDRKALPLPDETHTVTVDSYIAPRNHLEETLAGIWAEALGVQRVGIRDDFFEMGGDSFEAVRLILRILAAFPACQPSLAVLLKAPTVEQFARTLNSEGADWSCLVAVREGNERPPFFCVHGAGGNVLSMRDLAMALPPSLPFYCLQARGLDGEAAPFSSVEETAECYIDQIRSVQSHGPYYLGGGCYGGLVAFEMARRLRSMGETVSLVALMDTWNFAYGRFISKPKFFYFNTSFFLRRIVHHMKTLGRVKPRDWATYVLGRVRTFLQLAKSVARIAQGGDETQFPVSLVEARPQALEDRGDLGKVLERVRNASHVAALNFIPKPYDGHLLVFGARTRVDDPYRDNALGWRPVALGGVTAHVIDADHLSMFRNPAVGAIAEKLDRALREAQRATQEGIQSGPAILVSQERSEAGLEEIKSARTQM
jgi:amino acid adenylation domain-containing protein